MNTLLVGFDSAWTPHHAGAVVAALRDSTGKVAELGLPLAADFVAAERAILEWQAIHNPDRIIVLLDQPTIVPNTSGQRSVENIVGSAVSLRYGGMQPANTGRLNMFGPDAPLWRFLNRFGGAAQLPLVPSSAVIETYPVLVMIALGWLCPDARPCGRLPKYNPTRRRTFSLADWQLVCERAAAALRAKGLRETTEFLDTLRAHPYPGKADQDAVDALICLLMALHLAGGDECLIAGTNATGYIVAPCTPALHAELSTRCHVTQRSPEEWVRCFRWT